MRSYCAIYVDVGYLLASSATRVTGTSLRRGVSVDHPAMIQGLIEQAEADSGMPLLRVNWYDSGGRPGGMPDLNQDNIGLLPRVKLRLGRLSQTGEQKGVDLRMGLDLANYARNRVVDLIYLVSGDDDLTEAVEEAQFHGLQVVILAVPNRAGRPHAVAKNLQREADGVILIGAATIDDTVKSLALDPALIPPPPSTTGTLAASADDPPVDAVPSSAAGLNGSGEHAAEVPPTRPSERPGSSPLVPSPAGRPTPGPVSPAATEPTAASDVETTPALPDPVVPRSGPSRPPPRPKPTVLAGKRPSAVVPPRQAPAPTPAWSTSTGVPIRPDGAAPITDDLIDAVVRQVLHSWSASATPEMLIDLRRGEPFIPGDLDRTLLLDLSGSSGVYDIDDASRHQLRDRFWAEVKRLKMA